MKPIAPLHRIGAILLKDLRLLWGLALAVWLLQGVQMRLLYNELPFDGDPSRPAALVMLALAIAVVLAVITVIHQDAPASTRQDWLVRPIPRGELLLAKCAWLALVVHGSIFVANLGACLAHGFPLLASVRANLMSTLSIAGLFTLPFMALAAITRTLLQALLGALLGCVALLLLMFSLPDSTSGTGVRWVGDTLSHATANGSLIAVLWLQYRQRATARARAVFIAGLLAAVLLTALPWPLANRVSEWFAPAEGAGLTIALARSDLQATADLPGARPLAGVHRPETTDRDRGANEVLIGIPLRLGQRPADEILHTDRVRVRIFEGARLLLEHRGLDFDLAADADALIRQDVAFSTDELQRLSGHALRLEIDYALTGFRPVGAAVTFALNHAPRRVDDLLCAAVTTGGSGSVQAGCRALIELPDCLGFELAGDAGAQTEFACTPSYAPALLRFSSDPTEAVSRVFPMRLGVPGAQLRVSRYAAAEHWHRNVLIPVTELNVYRLNLDR